MIEEVTNDDVAPKQAIESMRPPAASIARDPFPADQIDHLFDRVGALVVSPPNSGNIWHHACRRARVRVRGPHVAPEISAAARQLLQPIFVHDSYREIARAAIAARLLREEL